MPEPKGGGKKKLARPVVLPTLSDTEDPTPAPAAAFVPAPASAPAPVLADEVEGDPLVSNSPTRLEGTHTRVCISISCQETEETTLTTDT